MKTDVCIIGAGPAGLISAIFVAKAGAKTVVIVKNSTAGQKLLLTGGGRCNLTHSGTIDDFVRAYGKCGRFLRHALYEFSPELTLEFFTELGVAARVDEEGCVFPVSEISGDVLNALLHRCRELGVQSVFGRGVERIERCDKEFAVFTGRGIISAQKVIIATGGASYPATGSTGDGYKLAKSLGHTFVEPRPALVPLVADEKWCAHLAGISRDNVTISTIADSRKVSVSGPPMPS